MTLRGFVAFLLWLLIILAMMVIAAGLSEP